MRAETMVNMKADRSDQPRPGAWLALAALATILLTPAAGLAADSGGAGAAGKSPVVTFENIPGSSAKRVILVPKAAERLGIQTGKVGEEVIIRKQMVGGLVMPPVESQPEPQPAHGGFGGFGKGVPPVEQPKPPANGRFNGLGPGAAAPAPKPWGGGLEAAQKVAAAHTAPQGAPPAAQRPDDNEVWVLVTLSPGEWERLAKDKPARLLPVTLGDKSGKELLAMPSGRPPVADTRRSMLTLYYMVPGKDHGLKLRSRLRVELQMSGDGDKQKVVPYSAVYYDAKGVPWVYINTRPLAFERQRIGVERIVGDLAVLSEGPSVGTPVVTVGAPLLYGAEIFGK